MPWALKTQNTTQTHTTPLSNLPKTQPWGPTAKPHQKSNRRTKTSTTSPDRPNINITIFSKKKHAWLQTSSVRKLVIISPNQSHSPIPAFQESKGLHWQLTKPKFKIYMSWAAAALTDAHSIFQIWQSAAQLNAAWLPHCCWDAWTYYYCWLSTLRCSYCFCWWLLTSGCGGRGIGVI